MSEAPATNRLAGFIAALTPDDVPEAVLARTRELVLDGAGALLAAADPAYTTGRLIAAFAADQGGRPEASVVGHGFRTGAAHAALANGTMGYACDFEPHHPEAILHPIAVQVPTALAVAERVGANGKAFLAAVALGCEVEYRVSVALGPAQQYALGFHPSAVCGVFGASAAAANLLGLESEAVVRALGLAACQASGLMAWESDPSENARPFQMGMAARNGVTAALLAGQGFGGPRAVFDHGHTVYRAFSREPSPGRLTEGLGEAWDGIMELAIKPYPCVAFLHPALDGLLALRAEEKLGADDVARLTFRFPRSGIHCVDDNPLKSHCAQYILAVALARGRLEVRDIFVDARESDAAIRALSARIEVVPDDGELEAMFPDFYASEIVIERADGGRLTRRNDVARGYPEAPMSPFDARAKFETLVTGVAGTMRANRLAAAVDRLAEAPDLSALAEQLRLKVAKEASP